MGSLLLNYVFRGSTVRRDIKTHFPYPPIVARHDLGSNGTYGNPSSSYPSSQQYSTIRGTILNVDTRNQTIELENTNWFSGFRTNNSSNRFVIRYDPNASVDYNGQVYPLTNLERGDVVDVQLQDLGSSNYVAQRLVLVRNVR
ncbi:MAG TPA: hypothetical protein VGQ65_06970 [Thermoanaerobaculia bacterium]|jgi:hypothetical protein|nr:hypothetical protein [Thermoanaerobaculia bacterium]